MPGQGTVTINGKQWSVSIATTFTELTQGLSGAPSIPPGTGMLFDMGSDRASISVNMSQMLFNLDIAFINSECGVVGILRNVGPGESAVFSTSTLGARYFMEVNAGEMSEVNVGDAVDIVGSVEPAFWAGLITAVLALSQVAIIGVGAYRAIKEEK